MAKLIVTPNYTYVQTTDINIIKQISDIVAFRPEGYRFSPKYKQHIWDGYIRLYSKRTNAFPTGLLDLVVDKIPNLTIEKQLVSPKYINYRPKPIELYPYQQEVFDKFLKEKHDRGIFSLAVNWGKSYLISKIIAHLSVRTLLVVHRTTLVYQLYETLLRFFDKEFIGLCADGKNDFKPITIATIQTLEAMGKDLKDYYNYYDMIMIDEAHRSSGKLYYKVMMNFTAKYRFGFTGTANKKSELENMQVRAITGPIIATATITDTITVDKSAKPTIKIIYYPQERRPLKYTDAYNELIVRNEKRNFIIKDIVEKNNKYTLIMVNFIEHGKILSKLLNAPFISGQDHSSIVMKQLKDFNNGKLKTLIISTIGDEGLNIARADVVILAGGGKSEVRTIQRIGRALRKYKGKTHVTIYDFMDDSNDILYSHSISRITTYKSEGLTIEKEMIK